MRFGGNSGGNRLLQTAAFDSTKFNPSEQKLDRSDIQVAQLKASPSSVRVLRRPIFDLVDRLHDLRKDGAGHS